MIFEYKDIQIELESSPTNMHAKSYVAYRIRKTRWEEKDKQFIVSRNNLGRLFEVLCDREILPWCMTLTVEGWDRDKMITKGEQISLIERLVELIESNQDEKIVHPILLKRFQEEASVGELTQKSVYRIHRYIERFLML